MEGNAEGKPNWEFTPSVAEAKPAGRQAQHAPAAVAGPPRHREWHIDLQQLPGRYFGGGRESRNFTPTVGAIDGPYALAGSATINGTPLKLDLSVGAKGDIGPRMPKSHWRRAAGKLSFKGTLSELGPNARAVGIASSSADNLIAFVETLVRIAGHPEPTLPPLLAGKFSFDGGIDVSPTALAAKDFRLALGEDSGSGSLSLTLKPALAIEGKLAAPKLDLDRWLAAIARPAEPEPRRCRSPPAHRPLLRRLPAPAC